jgi:hypothetical protein
MDADQIPPERFMTALTTEHFVLQGARSTLTAESASRAALYLASLTGSLIALGFVTRDASVLGPFAAAVLPALLVLGEFTYWRLLNAGIEDFHHRWEIERIRAYYRGLVPPGLPFFASAPVRASAAPVRQFLGVRARDLNVFLTVGSMVAAINSMVAGASIALALHAMADLSAAWAVGLASLIALALYLAHMRLAIRQYRVGLADLA